MAVTKTLNPLHFEDLEPKRFEDLVRELLYDFRDWYKIEPTGRTGSDEGYDTRAWEKSNIVSNTDIEEKVEDEDETKGSRALEGNLWMIQCKREKEIGAKRIVEIVEESIKGDVPYGYFLAAPVNFSKKTYDAFAEALRQKGVMEFFLWGKGEMEHMLMMPKNDRILFAFFGISLLLKRRSKVSEIKFRVNNKNKLFRVLDGFNAEHKSVLLRDINDINYPFEKEHDGTTIKKTWKEYVITQFHPKGLLFHLHEFYAFYDKDSKEFDFTKAVDIVHPPKENLHKHERVSRNNDWEEEKRVEYFYKHLPQKNQAKLNVYGFLFFEDMLLIDDKGDAYFDIPHIFTEYVGTKGHMSYVYQRLIVDNEEIEPEGKEKKIKVFPDKFPEIKRGTVYKDKYIDWEEEQRRLFALGDVAAYAPKHLHDIDGKYAFLNVKDVIAVKSYKEGEEDEYAEITHKYTTPIKGHLESHKSSLTKEALEKELGRTITAEENITVLELVRVYKFEIERT